MPDRAFISFEGIDGSGKDTQLLELLKLLKEENSPVFFGNKYNNIYVTREPTQTTKAGREISELIRTSDVDGRTASRLYIQDRIEHTQQIKEVLEFSNVLTARYDISTLTYQVAQGEDFEELFKLHRFGEEDGCIFPDLTIVFEIPAEVAFERVSKRGEVYECFEKLDFQKKLVEAQDYCIKRLEGIERKIVRINANQPIKNVTNEMVEKINSILK